MKNGDVQAIFFAGALHQAEFAVGDYADLDQLGVAMRHALLECVEAGLRRDGPSGFDGGFEEAHRVEILQISQDAMSGHDYHSGRVHVDQGHHDELRGRVLGIFVAIG